MTATKGKEEEHLLTFAWEILNKIFKNGVRVEEDKVTITPAEAVALTDVLLNKEKRK